MRYGIRQIFDPVSSYAGLHGDQPAWSQKTEHIDVKNLEKLFFHEVLDRRELVDAGDDIPCWQNSNLMSERRIWIYC
jgi:hypothetical protein